MWNKAVILTLTLLFCIIGCLWQIENVSVRYFNYDTKTSVGVHIPSFIHAPSISSCYRFNDIANFGLIQKEKAINAIRRNDNQNSLAQVLESLNKFNHQIKNFTVSDWFRYSPSVNDIFDGPQGCTIRIPERFVMSLFSGKDCIKHFNITKYLRDEFICYRFDPLFKTKLSVHEYALSPMSTGMIYSIFLNYSAFKNMEIVYTIVHSMTSSVLMDTIFSKSLSNPFKELPESVVTYREFTRKKLEGPYHPECDQRLDVYGSAIEYDLKRVNEISIKKFGSIVPWIPIYNETIKAKVPSELNFRNETFVNQINSVLREQFKIGKSSCINRFTLTNTRLSPSMRPGPVVAVFWPSSEAIDVTHVPDQELIDFIIYICSCIGIWFGLSVFSVYDLFLTALRLKGNNENRNESVKMSSYVKDLKDIHIKLQHMKHLIDRRK